MQNMILLLFAVFLRQGAILFLRKSLKVPTYRTSRAIPDRGEKAEEAGEKFGCLYHRIIQQNRPLPAHR